MKLTEQDKLNLWNEIQKEFTSLRPELNTTFSNDALATTMLSLQKNMALTAINFTIKSLNEKDLLIKKQEVT